VLPLLLDPRTGRHRLYPSITGSRRFDTRPTMTAGTSPRPATIPAQHRPPPPSPAPATAPVSASSPSTAAPRLAARSFF